MTGILSYKGYSARIEFDAEDRILTGRVAGIGDIVGFHAADADGIEAAFHEAVDDYLEACAQLGKTPDRSYSGKIMLRVRPELHARLALLARLQGKSLNQFGEEMIVRSLDTR